MSRFNRLLAVGVGALTLTAFVATTVDARPGRGNNAGSRGERTYAPPPATNTAPSTAQPINRSVTPAPAPTQAGRPAQPGPAAAAPAAAAARPNPAGALLGGLALGFLGAGLFGMLSGAGFFAGLGTLAGFFGFLFQLLLIGGLVWLLVRFMRARRPAPAGGPSFERQSMATGAARDAMAGAGPAAAAARPVQAAAPAMPSDTVGIGPNDYAAFERLLGDIQTTYGRGEWGALRTLATPEMAAYLEQEIRDDEARGVINRIRDVKLLQGDLAEAWREGAVEYATVAMRYSLVDETYDRATGARVSGTDAPIEATEVWSFRRENRGPWVLSAIQQA
jgi:predicted lipid-binding transport protein (Tim44 family)